MKVVFAGAGTGGHFYPLIAVAEELRALSRERRLLTPKLYYLAPSAFDQEALFENEIAFFPCPAGKWRRYFSIQNFTDLFVSATGFICALIHLFRIYPDVVFSKGGYASVPVVLAARMIGIPVFIHESDAKPGRANILASSFAYRIAVTFDSTTAFFPKKAQAKVARTGIPIRSAIKHPASETAQAELGLDPQAPTILILGGSLGAQRINDVVLSGLAELVSFANVIHQTGKDNFKNVELTSKLVLEKSEHASRYHVFPFLNTLSMRRAAGAAHLVISRAGMTAISEIALWHKPSILIPIPESVSHDQRTNAYAYAKTGASVVLEEANLTPHVLVSEARRILSDQATYTAMSEHTQTFANADAGRVIAEELLSIGLSHESVNPVV